jgi:hypothetical protein
MPRLAVLLFIPACLASCATMTPQAQQVKVIYNPLDIAPACTSLGEVKAYDGWGGMMAGVGYENAERYMREEAASRGANVLLSLSERGGLAGVSSRGQAYRCP